MSAAPVSTTRTQLLEILAPRRFKIAWIVVIILVGAGLELVPPLVIKQVVDEHLTRGNADGLWWLAVIYLFSVAGVQSLGFLTSYLTALTAQDALHELRLRLYRHLQRLPVSYYDQHPLGDSISRCTADVDTVDTLFSSGVAGLISDLVRLVTVSAAMINLSPLLALLSGLVAPFLLWVTNTFRLRIRDAERQNRIAVGLLNTHLQETLGGVEVIRAFGREPVIVARFRRVLEKTLAAFNRAAKYSALYSPIMQIVMALVIALLLWGGVQAPHWLETPISLGTLTAFVLLFKRFFDPITAIGEEWQTVQSAFSGAERIFQVLDLAVEETGDAKNLPRLFLIKGRVLQDQKPLHRKDAKNAKKSKKKGENAVFRSKIFPSSFFSSSRSLRLCGANSDPSCNTPKGRILNPGITVHNLTFGYAAGQPVLENVTFNVAPGEHVALVGRTGAGKSSIVNLLSGLYLPWQGKIEIAGRDPGQVPEVERRHWVGVVPQAVQLFSDSVLENLTLGDPGVTLDAVERAVRIAGADDLIAALPEGYQTAINNGSGRGVQLSAGQRQLLSLARALVWDPGVLIFDEATSAIDSASEAGFRAALHAETARHQRAILTVAHRLSTAREADRVIVLENGRILEMGSPEELIRAGGRFAALLELEAAGWDWHNHNV